MMLSLLLSAVFASDCSALQAPAVRVRVEGFSERRGHLRVRAYASSDTFLKRGGRVAKAKLPVPAAGAAVICLPLPRSGRYAVVVHHDLNGDGKRDRNEGGGASRNPRVSLLAPRPDFNRVAVYVPEKVVTVPITLQYLRGLAIVPVARGQ